MRYLLPEFLDDVDQMARRVDRTGLTGPPGVYGPALKDAGSERVRQAVALAVARLLLYHETDEGPPDKEQLAADVRKLTDTLGAVLYTLGYLPAYQTTPHPDWSGHLPDQDMPKRVDATAKRRRRGRAG